MKTHPKRIVFSLAMMGGVLLVAPSFGQGPAADEAMKLATKLTEEGAATFSKSDARAMAAYYTEDAIVFLESKNDDGHSVKEYDGRAEIERLYADLFKEPGTIQAKNTVEYCPAAGPRPPGHRGHLRAQPARGQADEIAVLPGPRQAGREVADPQPARLRAAREELECRTPGCLKSGDGGPSCDRSGDGAPPTKGTVRPVVLSSDRGTEPPPKGNRGPSSLVGAGSVRRLRTSVNLSRGLWLDDHVPDRRPGPIGRHGRAAGFFVGGSSIRTALSTWQTTSWKSSLVEYSQPIR